MKKIMEEILLRWTLNGREQEPFLCSSGDEEALLRGFLTTTGTVKATRIRRVARDGERWQVETEGGPDPRAGLEERLERTAPVSSDFRIGTEELEFVPVDEHGSAQCAGQSRREGVAGRHRPGPYGDGHVRTDLAEDVRQSRGGGDSRAGNPETGRKPGHCLRREARDYRLPLR